MPLRSCKQPARVLPRGLPPQDYPQFSHRKREPRMQAPAVNRGCLVRQADPSIGAALSNISAPTAWQPDSAAYHETGIWKVLWEIASGLRSDSPLDGRCFEYAALDL